LVSAATALSPTFGAFFSCRTRPLRHFHRALEDDYGDQERAVADQNKSCGRTLLHVHRSVVRMAGQKKWWSAQRGESKGNIDRRIRSTDTLSG
jgi:hypothetical protein